MATTTFGYVLPFSLLFILIVGSEAVSYKSFSSDTCEDTILIDCPTTASASAGRITFRPYLNVTRSNASDYQGYSRNWYDKCDQIVPCKLVVKTKGECGLLGDEFAVYFNARSFDFPQSSQFNIYDTSGPDALLRSWSSSSYRWTHSDPTSVAQVRSSFARQPAVSMEYTHSRGVDCRTSRKIVLDFIVVESRASVNNTRCRALDGYVNSEYICDTTDDRVNCPDYYEDSTNTMNPVNRRQYCLPSVWIIVGLTAASAVGLVVLIGLVVLLHRRCRKCVCRTPERLCNWSSQRQCSFLTPICSCSLKYDVSMDTGKAERKPLLNEKGDNDE